MMQAVTLAIHGWQTDSQNPETPEDDRSVFLDDGKWKKDDSRFDVFGYSKVVNGPSCFHTKSAKKTEVKRTAAKKESFLLWRYSRPSTNSQVDRPRPAKDSKHFWRKALDTFGHSRLLCSLHVIHSSSTLWANKKKKVEEVGRIGWILSFNDTTWKFLICAVARVFQLGFFLLSIPAQVGGRDPRPLTRLFK